MVKNFFDQQIDTAKKTYGNIVNGQGDEYTTGCLLDCPYFK